MGEYSQMAMLVPNICSWMFNSCLSPFPRSCHSVMWAPRQKFFLMLWPWKRDVCGCVRYISQRISPHTRVHECICFTCVPPCVISLLIQCGGAESALCGPHNAQTFFQLAGQVGLSGAFRFTVNLTQTKQPLGPAPKGQIERGRGRKLSKAV